MKNAKELCHLTASSRLCPTKNEEPQPATMLPSLPPLIHFPPNTTENSFNSDDTLPSPPTLVRCEYTLPMDDISVDQKQHDNTSPVNKTVSVDSGVVQGTSFSDTVTPDHESESPNVPSPAMESDSMDFFQSSATNHFPSMESDGRDFFPSSATAPSPAMESDSRDFFPSSPTFPSPANISYIPRSLFVPESSLDSIPSQAEELHMPPAF